MSRKVNEYEERGNEIWGTQTDHAPRRQIITGCYKRKKHRNWRRAGAQFRTQLASTALQKKGTPLAQTAFCTPQRLSTIRTDFCPHTNWQICPPLLKASSTHPVITTCAHNTKQTSEATTTSTNNTPTTSKQNAKAKQPLLATAAFAFRHPWRWWSSTFKADRLPAQPPTKGSNIDDPK